MSIPDRLWRLVRGQWVVAEERIRGVEAETAAYQELAEALRQAPSVAVTSPISGPSTVLPPPPPPRAPGQHDPLEACYELLKVRPGADMQAIDAAYRTRMEELRVEAFPVGSAERAAVEARREAIHAAYEKVRDLLNPTEARFEHLEF